MLVVHSFTTKKGMDNQHSTSATVGPPPHNFGKTVIVIIVLIAVTYARNETVLDLKQWGKLFLVK
jgi:hypothetical protein